MFIKRKKKRKVGGGGERKCQKATFLALPITIELKAVLLWHPMPTTVKFNSTQLVIC